MKKLVLIILISATPIYTQVTEDLLVNIHSVNNTQMLALSPERGALVYNTDEKELYVYDGTVWILSNTPDLTIVGNQLSISGGNTITLPQANGSETKIQGAGINIVTGTGTTADPYIITATEVDGSISNELNQTVVLNGTNLETTDAGGTISTDLSSLDQSAGVATNTTTINNHITTDLDTDATNEIQTISSPDNSVTVTANGNNYELLLPTTPGQTTLTLVKETIGYTFSSAFTSSTGGNLLNINSSITRTATGRYTVAFTAPHPNGVNYDVTLGADESATLRDGVIAQVVEGSRTANGFNVMLMTGDNGGTPDVLVNSPWSFQVSATKEVIVDVTGTGVTIQMPSIQITGATAENGCFAPEPGDTSTFIVNGVNFTAGTTISIAGQTVNSVTYISSSQLNVTVTASAASGNFDITATDSGTSSTLPNSYTVKPSLTTYNFAPADIVKTTNVSYTTSGGPLGRTSGAGWGSAGAHSLAYVIPSGNEGRLDFIHHSGSTNASMLGLTSDPATNNSYNSIDFAIYLWTANRIRIYENGTYRFQSSNTYSIGDTFTINKDCNGVVTYLHNGVLIYTSGVTAASDLYFDSSFYYSNTNVSNITISY